MNKVLKVYAVYGIMEWICQIVINGKCKMSIPFTGGTITGNGVTPALYRTDSPVTQAIIEHSSYFKSGKIELYRMAERDEPETRIKKTVKELPGAGISTDAADDDALGIGSAGDNDDVAEVAKIEVVKVTDLQDAKDYLAEKFGISRTLLRSKEAIMAKAKANGLEFEGI